MSAGPVWVLADAHGGAREADDVALLALLDRAIPAKTDLLVLGDLFLAWLGPERFLSELQRRVVDALTRVRAAGGRVRFVVGNRDYLVAEGQLGRAFDEVLEGEALIDLAGIPTLVTHGDRLNPGDRPYLLWQAVSRHPSVLGLVSRLPAQTTRRLAGALEQRMSGANRRYKTGDLPIEGLLALGRRAAAAGARRALVGHFHHDRTLDVPGGVPVVLAPPWLERRRILVGQPDGRLLSVDPSEAFG